jgi:hypothetical protein
MLPFREVWLADFEFQAGDGERPSPVCAVFREYFSNRELRFWHDELAAMTQPPFAVGRDVLMVAYYASAELGCFLALNWPFPTAVLDLYPEHRAESNGLPNGVGSGLLGAMAWHGLDGIAAAQKEAGRALVMRGGPWSSDERRSILDYCSGDVDALARLLPSMLPGIAMRGDTPRQGLGQALLRGRYMGAVARMEWQGIPIDTSMLAKLRIKWSDLIGAVIDDLAVDFPVYEGRSFREKLFERYLCLHGIAWPRLESGRLRLDDNMFKEMARAHPDRVGPIREVRKTLADLRLNELAVGSDGRNRTLLSAFRARTGRNQPSNSRFVFGPATWIRSLVTPPRGRALAYVDFSAQEVAIAGALSGDEGLFIDAVTDPYLGFGIRSRLLPTDATKETHSDERALFKAAVLGINYGMTERGLASRLNIEVERARQLIQAHQRTYPRFWEWSDGVIDRAQLSGRIRSALGWPMWVKADANPRALRNFPMQAGGADMLRLASIFATEAGLEICAPVHDALLIEADDDEIEDAVAALQRHMERASSVVLGGGRVCRTDARIVRQGQRFSDVRGRVMFDRLSALLDRPLAAPTAPSASAAVQQSGTRSGMVEKLAAYVNERERIRERKERGDPQPWTDDSLLREFSFCNVRREDDRTTRWIAEYWRNPHKDDSTLWHAMVVARLVNHTGTMAELGYPEPWPDRRTVVAEAMRARRDRRETVFGGAYIISGGRGGPGTKIDHVLGIFDRAWNAVPPRAGGTLAQAHGVLMRIDGLGSFLAAQVVADLKHTPFLTAASDWFDWAAPGPGSQRGLSIVRGLSVETHWRPDVFVRELMLLRDELEPMLQVGDRLCLQDIQNCLCEFSKYTRGYSKTKYKGGSNPASRHAWKG